MHPRYAPTPILPTQAEAPRPRVPTRHPPPLANRPEPRALRWDTLFNFSGTI